MATNEETNAAGDAPGRTFRSMLETEIDEIRSHGHARLTKGKCLEIETLKNELLQCKQEICRLDTHKVKLDLENKVRQEQALVIQRNKRNAELVQENDLLKSTLSGKEKSIGFLQSEKEKIVSEKKDLADSYLDEIVCLKNANKVARDMLQRLNMPTQTIPMLSKKPKSATADLHKDLLGTRNPGLGYMAKRAQPVLYDADTLLHPAHHPVRIWDRRMSWTPKWVSMTKMSKKTRHVRPHECFYEKGLNALCSFLRRTYLEIRRIGFLFIPTKFCYQASKSATPGLLLYICSIVLTSDIVVPPSSNCLCEDLRSACDREHTKVLELEAEISKQKQLITESEKRSCDQQALDTDRIQLKDTITSLRIQLDGLKVENVSLKRRYDELSKANTHSRTAYTEKLSAFTAENIPRLKAQVTDTKLHWNSQTMQRSHTRNHRILPSKSVNARRAAYHNRKLNVVDHNQFVIRSLKSVNTKTPQAKHSVNHTKKVWKATKNHNVNTTKTAWRPTRKVVGSVKPQWKPTGRYFALYDNCPLTRIMEPIVEPLELTPSVRSSSKVTMISRFTDCKLTDRKAGSKGLSGIF
ncbi:hypothetical protein Tco_1484348 [Tanacetum coccineum]